MAFKITLSDGTVLDKLGLNGNNFVSDTEVTPATFQGKLSTVTIEGPQEEDSANLVGTHTNMQFVQVMPIDGKFYFILRDLSPREIRETKIDGDLAYIAMMTDVDLD